MRIVFTARGLFFSGKARDLTRLLGGLASPHQLGDFLRRRLRQG